ncbi:hypothetical protein [Sphaerisporangium album]|uniref:hypothetical protein n=1 Tax=Sphaerisporangium album TaxID=509200 RepID=UPI0011C03BF7|nr:hypothetical protein [Sphaerisporangium album]
MARSKRYKLVRRLEDASTVVRATTGLLRHTSSLLRQLVMIVGWLVLLAGAIRLLLDPPSPLSPEHFLAPLAGAAAVFQGVIRPPAGGRKSRPSGPPGNDMEAEE